MIPEFHAFRKIPRRRRDIVITEKLDGTHGVVHVSEDGLVLAGGRSRWLQPGKATDNHGFAAWVAEHEDELRYLGPGYHYGEWWGSGINRGYGLPKGEKRFSLFNTSRWSEERPACCHVVPVLYEGDGTDLLMWEDHALQRLESLGSVAAPGFMKPEGIVIRHTASGHLYKVTIEGDGIPKGRAV